MSKSVIQEWVQDLTMMQQTVLLTAIRGPDGMPESEEELDSRLDDTRSGWLKRADPATQR